MKRAIYFILLTVVLFTLTLAGCGEKTDFEYGEINIIVTKDFGNEILFNKTVRFEADKSVMDVMEENFEISTAYGGGFIASIEGLKSGFLDAKTRRKIDWFYYVNGALAQVGAKDYYLKPNDVVIWDYYDWSGNYYISNIIGAYPYNFVNGYRGNILETEIRYEREYEEHSKKLFEFLKDKGVKDISLNELDKGISEREEVNSIIIGRWEEISKISLIKDILKEREKAGVFFNIENDLRVLNHRGEIAREFEKGAVIASISKGYDLTAGFLWLITGNDDNCIKKAARLLYEEPYKIIGKFAAVVTDDELLNLPIGSISAKE
ncbi:MAG: DUF4430 domain-containing protein [Firmicutes bacterium]|nr:DUF4430 domain-containing protein [Bacillota bacterium]